MLGTIKYIVALSGLGGCRICGRESYGLAGKEVARNSYVICGMCQGAEKTETTGRFFRR